MPRKPRNDRKPAAQTPPLTPARSFRDDIVVARATTINIVVVPRGGRGPGEGERGAGGAALPSPVP